MSTESVCTSDHNFVGFYDFSLHRPFRLYSAFFRHFPVGSLLFFEQVFAGEGETPPPEKQDRGPGLANEIKPRPRAPTRGALILSSVALFKKKKNMGV